MAAYLWMLLGCLAFSCMGELTHGLRSSCDWRLIALVRASLALVFSAMLAWAAGARLVFWRPGILWMRSIAGSIALVCTFFAFTRLLPTEVQTLTNTVPIWVALLSIPMLRETPTGDVWLSIASAIAGVVLIQQPHQVSGNFATLLALGSSFCTAVAMMGLHKLQDVDPWAIVVHFSGVSILFCLATFLFPLDEAPATNLDAPALLMLLGVGVAATIGQLCLTKAYAAGSPSRIAVVGLSQVVFSLILDSILWPDPFDWQKLLGVFLVVVPVGWLVLRRQAATAVPAIEEEIVQ